MIIRSAIFATLAGLLPVSVHALVFELPVGAVLTAKQSESAGSTVVPIAAFSDGQVPVLSAEGSITSEAWKIPSVSLSSYQIMAPLRQQLTDAGFEIILDCNTDECGGFDFRYEINVLPEPDMHVDLGDFRFLSAQKVRFDQQTEYVSLVVSRGGESGFVQMTQVGKPDETASVVVSSKSTTDQSGPQPMPQGALATLLETVGRAPLEDLSFKTGSSNLGDDRFGSLAELASYLKSNPDMSVALVGHTDAEGSLAGNMSLSTKRARSVLKRLQNAYDIPARQLEAAGVGYLVPRASNLTSEGRTQNRRVEVILTSTR